MMRNMLALVTNAILIVLCHDPAAAQQATVTTKNTSVKDVMHLAHKKPKELLKRVALGKATMEETKQLYDLYSIMAKHKPRKGDKTSWSKKTGLLVESVKAVMDGKPEGPAMLSKASNCKACHALHK